MRITLNGAAVDMPDETTLDELIDEQGLADAACATEVNRVIIPKKERGDRTLVDGDSIEIVTLVGGG